MTADEYLKNKRVLVMGLGLLGGGVATTKWLVKHGAKVTVTDLKSRAELAGSIASVRHRVSNKKVRFVLGRHEAKDFETHDIVVVNPAVPKESSYLKIVAKAGAKLENEAALFFKFCRNPIIAVTGTRGKTTTANWIHHFLKAKYGSKTALAGNSPEHPFLKELDGLDGQTPIVVEISSWHLELFDRPDVPAPRIAAITNLYPDHLNRHADMNDYASAKTNIFKHQTKNDFLILNRKNNWTKFFLKHKPAGKILYPADIKHRVFDAVVEAGARGDAFRSKLGEHNLENLQTAALAANLAGVSWPTIKKAVKTLPQIKLRQEIIYRDKNLTVVNDATATSPDATIAALKRFSFLQGQTLVLVTGGTDKKLVFDPPAGGWARTIKKFVRPKNLFLLEGSATAKMIDSLNKNNYFKKNPPQLFLGLTPLLTAALNRAKMIKGRKILLFSPAAASFEKFKNEFDRGRQFNRFFKKQLQTPY